MTSTAPSQCEVTGAKNLGPDMSEADICGAFAAGLAAEMDNGAQSADLRVALNISDTGTIDASITDSAGASLTPHPTVSIDVMDRALNLGDVEELARTVAGLMKNN